MAVTAKHVVTIEVSQKTYDRLQQKAVPFEDTPDAVIIRLLNESAAKGDGSPPLGVGLISNGGVAANIPHLPGGDLDVDVAIDDPFDPPSLKHTKVFRAEVDGREVAKANWTIVRQSVVAIALGQANNNLRRLLEVCPMNAVDGIKKDEGYTYYENLGVSIQGQDANHAWQAAAAPARALGVSVKVWFQWRTKPDAAYPGKWGLLRIG